MTRVAVFVAVLLLLLAGCGAHKAPSAEQVARSWSAALDRNDNEAAARLFADDAQIVQNGELTFSGHADAVHWNAALPCGGRIVSIARRNATDVLVVFRLEDRPGHACDAPGQDAAALFRVRAGKIVLWHQTDVPPSAGSGQTISATGPATPAVAAS
jgi:limonene-1,2-epoxide hydrolase